MKRLIAILMVVTTVVGCSVPLSKESYLKNFDDFVSDVADNHKAYSEKDWQRKSEKFEKFSGVWYEKFLDDFTLQEKLKITTNKAKYHYYSKLAQASSMFNEMFDALNVGEIKSNVQNLINTGMESELKQLYQEAQKAGKAAEEIVKEIFNELKINIDELVTK